MSEQLQHLTRREIASHVVGEVKAAVGVPPVVEAVQRYIDPTPISRRDFFLRHREAGKASVSYAVGIGTLGALTGADAVINPKGNFVIEVVKAGAQLIFNRRVEAVQAKEDDPLSYLTEKQKVAAQIPHPLATHLGRPSDPTPYEFFNHWYAEFDTYSTNGDPAMTDVRMLELIQGKYRTQEGQDRGIAFQNAIIKSLQAKGIEGTPDFTNAKLIYFEDKYTGMTLGDLTVDNLRSLGIQDADIFADDAPIKFNEAGTPTSLTEWQTSHRPSDDPKDSPRRYIYGSAPSGERGDIIVVESDEESDRGTLEIVNGKMTTVPFKRSVNVPVVGVFIPMIGGSVDLYDLVDGDCTNEIGFYPKPKPPVTPETPVSPTAPPELMFCENGTFPQVTQQQWEQVYVPKLAEAAGVSVEEILKMPLKEQLAAYSRASCQAFPTQPATPTGTAAPGTPEATASATPKPKGGNNQTSPTETPKPVVTPPPPTPQTPTSVPTQPAATATPPAPTETPKPVVTPPPPTPQATNSVATKTPVPASTPPPPGV